MSLRFDALGIFAALLLAVGCASQAPEPPPKSPETLAREAKEGRYRLIETEALAERILSRSNMILIDATSPEQYARHHLLGATNYLFPIQGPAEEWDPNTFGGPNPDDFARQLGPDKEIPVIVYSENSASMRSHHAALWASKLGYTNVLRYADGLAGWKKSGYEIRSTE